MRRRGPGVVGRAIGAEYEVPERGRDTIPGKAVTYFRTVATNKKTRYHVEAHWCLGLTYLKLEDKINAKKTFEAIVAKDGVYKKEESKDILEELEELKRKTGN